MEEKESIRGIPKEKVMADLQKYSDFLKANGAVEVYIVPPEATYPKVRASMCTLSNQCTGRGNSFFCPPEFPTNIKLARAIAKEYQYCLIIKFPRELHGLMGPNSLGKLDGQISLLGKDWPSDIKEYYLNFAQEHPAPWRHSKLPNQLEKMARADGYHFAFACRGGSCAQNECSKWGNTCLMRTSQYCRHPDSVRPDGAAGMFNDYPSILKYFGAQQAVGGFSTLLEDGIPEKFRKTYQWSTMYIV